ncbi:MAG: outer membrane beta-barrel protein [Gammaproteobacteria bacterium]|nr:outer membrane beta-barrel protein [Gammaproteobacteria bacterium]
MLKRITLIAASVAVLSLSAHAFAVTAQSGVYVGGNAGWSFAKDTSNSNMGASNKSNKNYVLGGTVGYDYALNQNVLVGAEFNYSNFGKTSYTNAGVNNVSAYEKNAGYQILATSTYLFSNNWNVFGKVGGIKEKTSFDDTGTIAGVNIDNSGDVSKWIPAAAIGAGYNVNQNLEVALQVEHTFGQNWNVSATSSAPSKPMTQNAVTLGATYKFAM